MMETIKSVFSAIDDIIGVLNESNIPSIISGEVRVASRRLGSKVEDIVVNSLIYDADKKQQGIFNVNIHVPNLKNQPSDNPTAADNTQPNIPRMQELGAIVSASLDNYNGYDFSLRLRSPGEIDSDGVEWIFNIQVEYTFLRTDVNG